MLIRLGFDTWLPTGKTVGDSTLGFPDRPGQGVRQDLQSGRYGGPDFLDDPLSFCSANGGRCHGAPTG